MVIALGSKNCADNFDIIFVPLARKTDEDKEYELEEIADVLFMFFAVGVVGKMHQVNVCREFAWCML